MKATRIITGLCLLLVMASGALAQKTQVDWDRGVSFVKYRTYTWGECVNTGESQLWDQRIVQNVEAQLAARGFRKAAPGQQPDVIVNYHNDTKERVSYVGYDYGYGYGPGWVGGPGLGWGPSWGWAPNSGPVTVEPIVQREFVLTVDLVDAQCGQLLWRGVANDAISRKSEKNIKRIRKAVAKLFEDYPPYRR